jgi:glycogen(starch) synthase
MRILFVSNFYPPHYIGGYELGCADAVESLKRRGHQIAVLTSTHGSGEVRSEGEVHRWLRGVDGAAYPPRRIPALLRRAITARRLLQRERANWGAFRKLVHAFRPDVVYVWNPVGVSIPMAAFAHRAGVPTCYYVFDEWMARPDDLLFQFWTSRPRAAVPRLACRLAERGAAALGIPAGGEDFAFRNVQFATAYLAESIARAGVPVAGASTIRWGIDPGAFPFRSEASPAPRRLLFVGQVLPHKGVHTLIEALHLLRTRHGCTSAVLSIVGKGDRAYGERLRERVRELGLEEAVDFRGAIERQCLSSVYREHDVLLFPSVWNEPFGITILEGMASGLPVVATGTGGSGEIVHDDDNALVFPAEDASECARQIARLLDDRGFFERIRRNARHSVENAFVLERTIDQIEVALRAVVESRTAGAVHRDRSAPLAPVRESAP